MLKILNKFFDFCGSVNKKKFQISIVLGVIQAVCEAMKIPAIMIVLMDKIGRASCRERVSTFV